MYEQIPQELKKRRQWVCFKLVPRGERMDKLPVDAKTGAMAKSNDSSTWCSFGEAVDAVERLEASGIGIMFADGLCGVDLDHCLDGGEPNSQAREFVETLQSYTEVSPSGTGLHILCLGKLPPAAEGRRRDAVEMYDTTRFFTVTGNAYLDANGQPFPLWERTLELGLLHRKFIYKEPPKQMRLTDQKGRIGVSASDQDLLERMFAGQGGDRLQGLYQGSWQQYGIGDGSQSAADQAFCNALAFWFGRDAERMDRVFRASGLMRPKWDRSVGGGVTYGQRTLDRAIQSVQDTYDPSYSHPMGSSSVKSPTLPSIESMEERPMQRRMAQALVTPDPKLYTYDDTGNAYRFRDTNYRDIKYNHVDKVWMVWDGIRWAEDYTGEVKRRADELLLSMWEEATRMENTELAKHVKRTRSNKNKEAMLRETQHMEGVYIVPNEFDRYRNAINLQNGVLDLRKGIMRPHNRDYYLSLVAGVSYEQSAVCPTWLKFLEDITLGDQELILYLQRMVGYCLTGLTDEQCVFFLYGNGKNGKSTFVSTITALLGEYAKNTQPETVMLRDKGNSARSDIARLKGARLVSTFEPNAGCRLDEGMVKQMTGEDTLTARFLYRAEFEFRPEFKILMATNVKPTISGTDNGIWRRIKLIPFDAQIPQDKLDKRLPEKLRAELPGVLNWAIEGAKGYYQQGLPRCHRIEAAVTEYRTEMDRVQQFIDDCVVVSPQSTLQAAVLYDVYKTWCEERRERYPLSNNKFAAEFKKHFQSKKTSMYAEYLDVAFTERGTQLLMLAPSHHSST